MHIIAFKNNLPNLTVLRIFSQDVELVINKLKQNIKKAPMMFIGMQVIIDLSAFDKETELVLNVDELLVYLRNEGLNTVAFMTDKTTFREILVKTGIGVLPVLQSSAIENAPVEISQSQLQEAPSSVESSQTEPIQADKKSANEQPIENKFIKGAIRSGQCIYSKGDLTIIGSVSRGAEVIADGNIHIYGRLSGKALAGAQGNEESSIMCQNLDAELVSIAGNYKQLDDIEAAFLSKRVRVYWDNDKIVFSSL